MTALRSLTQREEEGECIDITVDLPKDVSTHEIPFIAFHTSPHDLIQLLLGEVFY